MHLFRASPFVLALALAGAACAPARPGGAAPSRDSYILRADEIAAANVSTAYDAVMRLRPQFLSGRGRSAFGDDQGVRFYIDGIPQTSVEDLRSISAGDVVYIRYLSATDATIRYGTGFSTPIVYVLTRAMANPARR